MNVCEPGAITKITVRLSDNSRHRGKPLLSFIVNLGLLIFGLAMSISGFVIQFRYHMRHNVEIDSDNSGLGIDYYNWTNVHKISIIIFSIFMTYHFILHWKWYKTIIIKKLAAKNKLQIILLIVFILAAITGFIPWLIDLTGGSETARKFFIEIHDKIAILLFVLLTIHVTNRIRWLSTNLDRIINKQST
jgi:hypothetical protein